MVYAKEYIGKWRYALSPKLKKRINRANKLKLCLRIDRNFKPQEFGYCGTTALQQDCPFYYKEQEWVVAICLAPMADYFWHKNKEEMKQFLAPRYKKDFSVVGCYIAIFCERGYQNYLRMQAWKRRAKLEVK